MDPRFLSLDEILIIHRDQLAHYGGEAGLRDIALLESAVAMPGAGFGDERLHRDIFEMAAAYLFHIVQNHPFLDGNKRTGAVAAVAFLELNGTVFQADNEELVELVMAVAVGRLQKPEIAAFFRRHCRTRRGGPK